MKLDLLYEFQPKVKPWDQPHPFGQRAAEQAAYDEAFDCGVFHAIPSF
jgi:hypothetical protein